MFEGICWLGEDHITLYFTLTFRMSRLYTRKDGGWGWVIVIAAFTLNFLTDGVRYSFGIMLVEWHDEFEGGMAEISWVASLMFGLILIAG